MLSKLGTCFNAIEKNAQDTIDLPTSRKTVDKTEKVFLTGLYLPYLSSESHKVYLNLGYHYFPKKCWNLFNRNKIINSYEENRTKKKNRDQQYGKVIHDFGCKDKRFSGGSSNIVVTMMT